MPEYDVSRDDRGWFATRRGERASEYCKTRREAEYEATKRMVHDLNIGAVMSEQEIVDGIHDQLEPLLKADRERRSSNQPREENGRQ